MNSITGWVERHSLTEEQFQRIFDQEWVSWMMSVVIGLCVINILCGFFKNGEDLE